METTIRITTTATHKEGACVMGRVPALVVTDNGQELYGLYNATVDQMQPWLFTTREARDEWRDQWAKAKWYKCGCRIGEPCTVQDYEVNPLNRWRGQVCVEHLCFLGPYRPPEPLA